MTNALQKYEKWTPDAIDDERQAIDNESEFFKVKVGRSIVRFLPPRPGTRSPFVKVWQHYVELPGMSSPASFACPRLNGAKRACIVCKRSEELRGTGNPADQEMGSQIRASKRIYSDVIVRANEARGPVIFPFGKMIYDDLINLAQNPDWGDFSDPGPEGYDVAINRTGTGKNDTRYKVVGARNCTPLSTDAAQIDTWLECAHDLQRFARVPSEEELAAMLGGFARPSPPRNAPRQMASGRTAADDVTDAEFDDE